MRPTRLVVTCLIPLMLALSGCTRGGAAGPGGGWGSMPPFPGGGRSLAAPSGDYVLEALTTPAPAVVLRSAQGATLVTLPLSEMPGMRDMAWCPDSTLFSFVVEDKAKGGLYACGIGSRRTRCVVAGDVCEPSWSSDSRYLACLRRGDLPESIPQRVRFNRGSLVVLDRRRTLAPVGTLRGAIGPYAFSPDNSRVAFTEVVEDEYGDLGRYVLRVAEVGSTGAADLASDRREPEWIWAGESALAVATYDRYAVPSLGLLDLGGSQTPLLTAPEFAALRPRAYDTDSEQVVYEAIENVAREPRGELWGVRAGARPERLAPDDPAYQRLFGGPEGSPGSAPGIEPPGAPSE